MMKLHKYKEDFEYTTVLVMSTARDADSVEVKECYDTSKDTIEYNIVGDGYNDWADNIDEVAAYIIFGNIWGEGRGLIKVVKDDTEEQIGKVIREISLDFDKRYKKLRDDKNGKIRQLYFNIARYIRQLVKKGDKIEIAWDKTVEAVDNILKREELKESRMRKNRRFKEEELTPEEIYDKTIDQVEDDINTLSKMSMSDYEEKDDPEITDDFLTAGLPDAEQYISDEVFTENKKQKCMSKLQEGVFQLANVIEQYLADNNKTKEEFDADDFKEFHDNYIPENHRYFKYPKQLQDELETKLGIKVNRYANAGKTGKGSSDKNDEEGYKPKAGFVMSDDAKKFADMYAKTSEDVLADAAETCQEKYDAIYDTVRSILLGRATLPHALICGDGGIGKCIFFHTPLSIQVEDSTAEEIESWLKSQNE